ncbi:hypothetical protein K0M31_000036, partial [Melipona bicolor]
LPFDRAKGNKLHRAYKYEGTYTIVSFVSMFLRSVFTATQSAETLTYEDKTLGKTVCQQTLDM